MTKNTIYALSSAQGKSAIAIIRVSGPFAYKAVKSISTNMPKKTNQASLNNIVEPTGPIIDQTITTYFKSPKSYTGEDMVEITTHGSNAVIKKITNVLSKIKNLRMADPGEFTRRAFENNKLDLTQVEAIADIINAETEMQRKQSIEHLSGSFFSSSKKIFESLKKILANIEATIDFSEEDLPKNILKTIKEQTKNNIKIIDTILSGASRGLSIRDGYVVGVIGKPNTGKSSFINNISGKEIAIVTNKPGTTRDVLESYIDMDGYPIRFMDTAGIRRSKNLAEKIGINRAIDVAKNSNINLVFIDNKKEKNIFPDLKNKIFIKSKQDISKKSFKDKGFYNISSKTGYGIEKLLDKIKIKIEKETPSEKSYISRERHILCLKEAKKHLLRSKENKKLDLAAEDIRMAIKNIQSLFGNVDIEDILDIVFSDFCIGK